MQRRFVYSAQAAGENTGDEKVAGLIPDTCTSPSKENVQLVLFLLSMGLPLFKRFLRALSQMIM